MSQRFTLDRSSFEQVLCAASLVQQLNQQDPNGRVPDHDGSQPLSDLVEAQLAIETGTIDLEAAMNRVVGLAVKLSRATGAATWLFNRHEFVYRAATGSRPNDGRLQPGALSELASICGASDQSRSDPRESNQWSLAPVAHYPGSVKSLLVAPIYHGRSVAGALAVFSIEFNAFTQRDTTEVRLLSGLLTNALGKAAEAELRQNISQERATMLQAIDQLIPALEKLAENKHESSGDRVFKNSDSLSELKVQPVITEFEPSDCLRISNGTEQTSNRTEESSLPAFRAPEPTEARESTVVPVSPNVSTPRTGIRAHDARIPKRFPFWAVTGLTKLAHRQLSRARSLLSTTRNTVGGLLGIVTIPMRLSAPSRHKLNLPVLVPRAVLPIMLVFLFLITRVIHPFNTAVATSEPHAAAKLLPASEASRGPQQPASSFPAHPKSHMQVTDPATSTALLNLSRYEIVGLRRRAAYGDDSAALLLGMAYETGYLVPQNCIKAGEWVTQSANEGNAAAQYNLGLRYRQGDGEPVNQELATRWLRRAAAQNYSQAQLALQLTP